MKFEQIAIKNFRNFENIEICVSNKNIFFGLNDIGKTNFLYALRYVFDKDIRKNGFLDSDFHRKNVALPIEITVVIDISDKGGDFYDYDFQARHSNQPTQMNGICVG